MGRLGFGRINIRLVGGRRSKDGEDGVGHGELDRSGKGGCLLVWFGAHTWVKGVEHIVMIPVDAGFFRLEVFTGLLLSDRIVSSGVDCLLPRCIVLSV